MSSRVITFVVVAAIFTIIGAKFAGPVNKLLPF